VVSPLFEIIGESHPIAALKGEISRLFARRSASRRVPPVLILGETGTGKGLLARALHRAGPRAAGPFVSINCAAIPESLLEAELFGFERGAFTDAHRAKPGLFQVADGGTLFLDEIGLLPPPIQGKLLKAIEEREVRRLGATRNELVDVWILAATSDDLLRALHERRFHEALYHRLSVLTFSLPPLRERGRDVLLLAEHFLGAACADYGPPMKVLSPDAAAALLAHPWPGNVRELANAMERVALLSESATITADILRLHPPIPDAEEPAVDRERLASEALPPEDRASIVDALARTKGNVARAAKLLGISRNAMRYRMEKLEIGRDRQGAAVAARAPMPAARAAETPSTTPTPPPPEPTSPTVRWEHRRVTLLRAVFTLPSDSMLAPLPSPEARPILDVAAEKVASFGGRLEELGPEGVIATFGVDPSEDVAMRAALCALAIARAAERASSSAATGRSGKVAFRAAIHSADLVVGRIAARAQLALEDKRQALELLEEMLERADADAIVVSEAASADLERRFHLGPLGALGDAPLRIFRLGGHAPTPFALRGRATTFVGRSREVEILRARAEIAARAAGQVAALVGEPGIGKSRLLYEFRQTLGVEFTYLEAKCVSYDTVTPYLPLLELVRQCCGVTESDEMAAVVEKVRSPFLLRLLGIEDPKSELDAQPAELVEAETFAALRRLLLSASRRRFLVIGFEDLQWIDETSADAIASLVDAVADAAILLVVTYRPGYRPPWLDKAHVTELSLQPLPPLDGLSVVHSILAERVSDGAAHKILEKSDGNPFFLEELARAVAEESRLGSGRRLPGTIREVITARIDRLPEEPRRLLQSAAVLGREVSPVVLKALWEGNGGFDRHLQELKRLEFLYEQAGLEGPVYLFKHALTQEVAYESLLPHRRRALRAAAGRALEALAGEGKEGRLELAAHPYRKV
jgi:transcriptional regulator with AAA-type ATPase domain